MGTRQISRSNEPFKPIYEVVTQINPRDIGRRYRVLGRMMAHEVPDLMEEVIRCEGNNRTALERKVTEALERIDLERSTAPEEATDYGGGSSTTFQPMGSVAQVTTKSDERTSLSALRTSLSDEGTEVHYISNAVEAAAEVDLADDMIATFNEELKATELKCEVKYEKLLYWEGCSMVVVGIWWEGPTTNSPFTRIVLVPEFNTKTRNGGTGGPATWHVTDHYEIVEGADYACVFYGYSQEAGEFGPNQTGNRMKGFYRRAGKAVNVVKNGGPVRGWYEEIISLLSKDNLLRIYNGQDPI